MIIRAGVPVLAGVVLAVFGVQQLLGGLAYPDAQGRLDEVRGGLLPIGAGLALLVVGMAIARRTRLGYVLGMALALGLIVIASLFGLSLAPRLNAGGFNLAPAFLILTGIALLLFAGYGVLLRRGREGFAGTWGRADRRFGIAIAALLITATAASTALGAVTGAVQGQARVDAENAQALVDGTTFEVRVVDATVDAANQVEHLALDVRLRSTTAYVLAAPPSLCLTDLVTATEVGKLGVLCWGADEPGLALNLASLTVPPDGVSFEVALDRGQWACAYLAGPWSAALLLQPALSPQERLFKQAEFTVAGMAASSIGAGGSPIPCGISK